MFEHKNLIIDTSVLIDSPQVIHSLNNSNIFLTLEVLEELDHHKIRKDHVGKSARYINRFLDTIREKQSLIEGAKLDNGSKIYVLNGKGYLAPGLVEDSNDNKIISVAIKLSKEIPDVIVLSNDIAFRVKCDALGVNAYSYSNHDTNLYSSDLYDGIRVIPVQEDEINLIYQGEPLCLFGEDFIYNECVILKCGQASALAKAIDSDTLVKLQHTTRKGFSCEGIKPRSAEQTFAMELLLDPKIDLVTITGFAGTGKTLLAVATAMYNLHNNIYNKIIISRPMESSSKDIGFLPGSLEEKMAPWVQPIFDNLEAIYGKKGKLYIDQMIQKGQLEIEALTFIRGRTLPNTIFIVDEAQNISYDEAKAIISRMGENSKLILLGDLEQIDSPKLNESNSGLANTIQIFKDYVGAAHITLRKGERSALATFAAENM